MSFRIQSVLFLISVSIIVTILWLGYRFYYQEKGRALKEKQYDLHAFSDLKMDQLIRWKKERFSEAYFFSSSDPYAGYVSGIASGDRVATDLLRQSLLGIMTINRYENIFLLDRNGKMIFSIDTLFSLDEDRFNRSISRVYKEKKILMRDFYPCEEHQRIHLDIMAPVLNKRKDIVGVLVFRINPEDYLYPLIKKWPTPSETAETYLVRLRNDSVQFLSPLRHINTPPLQLFYSVKTSELVVVKGINVGDGVFQGLDYAGNNVLSDVRKIPDTPWFIVSEVDMNEVLSEFNQRMLMMMLLVGLLIIVIVLAAVFVYQVKQRRVFKEMLESTDQLYRSQQEYGAILYSIGDGVITTDAHGHLVQVNPVAEELTEWKEEDALGKPLDEVFVIVNEQTGEPVESPVSKVLDKGQIVGLANHTILISKSGNQTPIADSGAPIKNELGEITGVVLVFRDQTEERLRMKMMELRLRLFEYAADHSLKKALEMALDEIGNLVQSPLGFYHFVEEDQQTIRLQAWSSRTMNEFCTAVSESDRYPLDQAGVWVEAVHQRKPVIHNNYDSLKHKKGLPDGHVHVIRELVVPVLRNQKVVAVLGVGNKPSDYNSRDVEIVAYLAEVVWEIAERKWKEELLKESEARYKSLHNASFGGIVIHDKGLILECNQGLSDITGYSYEELIGMDGLLLIEEKSRDIVMENIVNEYEKPYEVFGIRKSGHRYPVQIQGKITPYKGKMVRTTEFRDISELKKVKKALQDIEWMLSPKAAPNGVSEISLEFENQSYGDLTALNTDGLIKRSVSREILHDIVSEYMSLLETSSAIYEKNGDYAYGIFSSGWCRFMDDQSRSLCGTADNTKALSSDRWHCHKSCWECSLKAMEHKVPCDMPCEGGIHLYAVPVFANGEVVGAINFGYGDPPTNPDLLQKLATRFETDVEILASKAQLYNTRPAFIIEMAKSRIQASARLIGILVELKLAETELQENRDFIRTIIDNLPVGIAVNTVEPSVSFEFMNDNFALFYDVSPEQLQVPDGFWEAAYPDPVQREEIRNRVLKDTATGDPEKMFWKDIPVIRSGKPVKYITARNIPLPQEGLMISTVWDVTERKLAENDLRAIKENLEVLVEDKTVELRERIAELERFHQATIDRELRMKELRDELKKLKESQ